MPRRPLRPCLSAGQGAVHKRLVGQEILEAGAEAGLVIIPLETILLGLAHFDKRLEGKRTFTAGAITLKVTQLFIPEMLGSFVDV